MANNPTRWRAALPMYVAPAEVQAASQEWLANSLASVGLKADLGAPPERLIELWRDPQLLLAQTCGYPLMTQLQGQVRVIGRPLYRLPDSPPGWHCSLLVARADDPRSSLAEFRGARLVINSEDSNTGMNLLRHAVAPLAVDGQFFASVALSGGHRNSLAEIAAGRADLSAVDSVTWQYLARLARDDVAALKVVGQTAASPTLPLIGALNVDAALANDLLEALNHGLTAALRASLGIDAVIASRAEDYHCLLDYQQQAVAAGYPLLR